MIATFVLVSSLVLNWNTAREGHHDLEEVSYKGHTRYSVQGDSTGTWLHAEADGQNSVLIRRLPMTVHDATLQWRWRVLRHPAGADPRVRSTDDRAAAVVVIVHRSVLPWRTRALIYQWAPACERARCEPSPYGSGIRVITVENAAADGEWRTEERDLTADLRVAFGKAPPSIEAIGVLCDADNTKDRAVADSGPLELLVAVGTH